MWSYLGSFLRAIVLICLVVFLAPSILALLFFSMLLKKDAAHFSH